MINPVKSPNEANLRYCRLAVVFLWVLSSLLSSCAPIESRQPQHRVIMQHELHAGMKTMARHLNTIASLGFEDTVPEEDKTTTILGELEQIKGIANEIASPGEITNYSVINRYMDSFIYDVHVAEQFSRRAPPNHFPAYTLVKSCLSCHSSI